MSARKREKCRCWLKHYFGYRIRLSGLEQDFHFCWKVSVEREKEREKRGNLVVRRKHRQTVCRINNSRDLLGWIKKSKVTAQIFCMTEWRGPRNDGPPLGGGLLLLSLVFQPSWTALTVFSLYPVGLMGVGPLWRTNEGPFPHFSRAFEHDCIDEGALNDFLPQRLTGPNAAYRWSILHTSDRSPTNAGVNVLSPHVHGSFTFILF